MSFFKGFSLNHCEEHASEDIRCTIIVVIVQSDSTIVRRMHQKMLGVLLY